MLHAVHKLYSLFLVLRGQVSHPVGVRLVLFSSSCIALLYAGKVSKAFLLTPSGLQNGNACFDIAIPAGSRLHAFTPVIRPPNEFKMKWRITLYSVRDCHSVCNAQIMEYTGRCISISEPDSPNVVAARYRLEGNSPQMRQLARDVIRWECRPYPSMQPQPLAYAVKLSAPAAVALELFV